MGAVLACDSHLLVNCDSTRRKTPNSSSGRGSARGTSKVLAFVLSVHHIEDIEHSPPDQHSSLSADVGPSDPPQAALLRLRWTSCKSERDKPAPNRLSSACGRATLEIKFTTMMGWAAFEPFEEAGRGVSTSSTIRRMKAE